MAAPQDALMRRTLRFASSVATQLAVPGAVLRGGHAVGEGFLFKLVGGSADIAAQAEQILRHLRELSESDEQIASVRRPWKVAHDYFEQHGLEHSKALVMTRVTPEVQLHECCGCLRLAVHPVLDSCGKLDAANIRVHPSGDNTIVVTFAGDSYAPQPALVQSFTEHAVFDQAHGVESVGGLNSLQQVGRGRLDYVLQCEFRQEQKLAAITADVHVRYSEGSPVKLVCIAGPTSSGKTTFANKLCMYLKNSGFVARALSVDHYYLPLDEQPRYKERQQRLDVDYDHIESMDVDLVGEHLNALIAGQPVMTPVYNMKTGYRDGEGHRFEALPENGVLVIEGIHALNPSYTQTVDASKVYRIFISPLTALHLDDANCVKTTDHRLLRRMCRDYLFRGNSASVTLQMWDNVRRGEAEWIFPHQNGADFVMNSAAEYEIPMLKTFIEPLLRAVTPEDQNFGKARELLDLLDHFASWPPHLAPGAALVREFIGDGLFDCH